MTDAPQGHQAPPTSSEAGGARVWRVRLPYVVPPLSLNQRSSWQARARKTADVRTAVGWTIRAARIPRLDGRPTVLLTYVPRDRRRRDRDNLVATLKPCVDALVDMGVLVDDDPTHVDTLMPTIGDPSPDPDVSGLWLTITADPYPGMGHSPT